MHEQPEVLQVGMNKWTTTKDAKSFWALTFDSLLLKLCHFQSHQNEIIDLLSSCFILLLDASYQALKFECHEHLLLVSFLCSETPITKTRNLLPLIAIHKLENVKHTQFQTLSIGNQLKVHTNKLNEHCSWPFFSASLHDNTRFLTIWHQLSVY